jgi:glycosyltransferase involved in cell wall biosynthesis
MTASSTPTEPFWSVIVPLYERRAYLKQCLGSVLGQGLDPAELEVVVVDDASPSDLGAFVQAIGEGRVQYVRNARNLGLYPSTNEAIRRARGRWIHILHDDDWIMPGFYRTLREGIEASASPVGVAFCMYANWHEPAGTTWSPPPFRNGPGPMGADFLLRLVVANPLNLPAVVFRRDLFEKLGPFREDLPFTADWEWYVRSALKFAWHHQPESLARWRVHAANQTIDLARAGRTARDIRRTIETFAVILPPDVAAKALPMARQFHAHQLLGTALSQLRAGENELSARFLYESLLLVADAASQPELLALLRAPSFAELRQDLHAAIRLRLSCLSNASMPDEL